MQKLWLGYLALKNEEEAVILSRCFIKSSLIIRRLIYE